MRPDDAVDRERQRELVRRGYDAISRAYRSDDGRSNPGAPESTADYDAWLNELATTTYLEWLERVALGRSGTPMSAKATLDTRWCSRKAPPVLARQ